MASKRVPFRATILALCFAALTACGTDSASAAGPRAGADPAKAARVAQRAEAQRAALGRAKAIVVTMDLEALAGQAMMIGVDGDGALSKGSKAALGHIRPGAVVLFGYNVSGDPASVADLCEDIASTAAPGGLPPLIAIDHEGGPVFRFKKGLSRLPSAARLGAAGEAAVRAGGAAAGAELRAVGVTMNLAPVAEALNGANASFLADRAFSADPEAVGRLAAAFAEECQAGGAAAVLKHFPGSAADPHKGAALIDAGPDELERAYLGPFRAAIEGGAMAAMLSHAVVSALDPDRPATVSETAIRKLRDGLGFGGVILTDDLAMAAVSGAAGSSGKAGEAAAARAAEAGVAALAAGADLIMVSGGPSVARTRAAILAAVADGRLPRARLEEAASRVIAVKLRLGLDAETPGDRARRLAGLPALLARDKAALDAALARPKAEDE